MKKRFFGKLLAAFSVAALLFATHSVLMRSLGASDYGILVFIQNHFEQAYAVLDLGLATAIFSVISRAKSSKDKISEEFFLQLWVVFSLFLLIAYILTTYALNLNELIWPNISLRLLLVGALALGVTTLFTRQQSIYDARRISLEFEKFRVLRACLIFIAIAVLVKIIDFRPLDYFLLIFVATIVLCIRVFLRNNSAVGSFEYLSKDSGLAEVYRLAKPLALYTVFSGICGMSERWVLQIVAGPRHQGYFAAATQISQVIFLLSGAFIPVFASEIGNALARKDSNRLHTLVFRESRLFFGFTALLAFNCLFSAETIMNLLGGEDFKKSSTTALLMFLYPIHQFYGQVWASMATVSGFTKEYALIGGFGVLINFAATYLLVGSENWALPGFNMGSVGFAAKAVGCQLIAVYSLLVFMGPKLRLSRRRLVLGDIKSLLVVFCCVLVSFHFNNFVVSPTLSGFDSDFRSILVFGLTGVLSSVMFGFILLRIPNLLDLPASTSTSISMLLRLITPKK